MKNRSYKVVDAFSSRSFLGKPVTVVQDAKGLDAAAMQAIARWTNLSETTFVLLPTTAEADYRLGLPPATVTEELGLGGNSARLTEHHPVCPWCNGEDDAELCY